MMYPSLDDLMKKVDCKYSLVVAAAKRARQISEPKETATPKATEKNQSKSVTVALEEINSGKVKYARTKTGIK